MIITDIDNLLDKIQNILIEVGQSDPQFKLGDWITYKPHEVRKILEQHKDELGEDQGEIMTLPESAKGFMYLNEEGDIVKEHEKISEEDKLKNALRFLKEYCDNHEYCEGCYIRRKAMLSDNAVMFQHGSCLFKTLISFLGGKKCLKKCIHIQRKCFQLKKIFYIISKKVLFLKQLVKN